MARLIGFVSLATEVPGFLVPLFRAFQGANQQLVQVIDEHDRVRSFETIEWQGRLDESVPPIESEVGESALWAFRDAGSNLHVGSAREIEQVGQRLLSSGALRDFPLVAAELAAFCRSESDFPDVMTSAFTALRRLSQRSADVWRDTTVLLPLLKEDIENQIDPSRREKIRAEGIIAITRESVTHIYMPAALGGNISRLPRWQAIAKIFDIHRFELHRTVRSRREHLISLPAWTMFGAGGVARYVIQKAPFHGNLSRIGDELGAIVNGPLVQSRSGIQPGDHLVIAIVPSDLTLAAAANETANGLTLARRARTHALNIRPIGFGTPRKDKPSPEAMRQALSNFSCVWIIANHRLRQSGSYANNLSAQNVLSRYVKAAASNLISALGDPAGQNLLDEAERGGGIGLFGATRLSISLSERQLCERVLYSMLCEEALLHSASKIYIVWPSNVRPRRETVTLGSHKYSVQIIGASRSRRNPDVVGFATNVRLAERSESVFWDFCISLVAGYGWEVRYSTQDSLLLENEGETLRIWPAASTMLLHRQLERKADQSNDLIITNQSISSAIRGRAEANGWALLHYSELGRWMRLVYRVDLFSEVL